MKNGLIDLNNHLFAALERINDEELTGDKFAEEVERTKAVVSVSKEIVANARTLLDAEKLRAEYGPGTRLPEMLERKQALEHKA